MSAVAEQLKRERRNQKLTQDQVAKRMGVQQSSISHWENGVKDPSLPSLERWAEALGLGIVALPDAAVRAARGIR